MDIDVVMPQLGSEMTEGTIIEWLKKEGDRIEQNEPLFMIDTGKAVMEVESEVSGILKEIVVDAESEGIPVGQTVAIIETAG